jgi:hypothetical protein
MALPSASKMEAVQSRRSLMFGEKAALTIVSLISSTIVDSAEPMTSISMASGRRPAPVWCVLVMVQAPIWILRLP